MDPFRRDPVLRLLPDEVPEAFLRLDPTEQAWRGRAWLIMYGAGFEPIHAWWFVLSGNKSPASAEWITFMKATIPGSRRSLMMASTPRCFKAA